MPVLLTLVKVVVMFVSAVCTIFYWMLIVRIVLSWFGVSPYTHYNELLNVLFKATDTLLKPFQRLPLRIGMIDFSAILAIIILSVIPELVASLLYSLLGVVR